MYRVNVFGKRISPYKPFIILFISVICLLLIFGGINIYKISQTNALEQTHQEIQNEINRLILESQSDDYLHLDEMTDELPEGYHEIDVYRDVESVRTSTILDTSTLYSIDINDGVVGPLEIPVFQGLNFVSIEVRFTSTDLSDMSEFIHGIEDLERIYFISDESITFNSDDYSFSLNIYTFYMTN